MMDIHLGHHGVDNRPAVVWKLRPRLRTVAVERLLLLLTIALMPLENHLPTVAGFSIVSVVFIILGVYVLFNRPAVLLSTCGHPVFLAAYIWVALSFFVELAHPLASFVVISRIGHMVVGALFVASLCRDKAALRMGIYGYIIAGLGLSILLFTTAYEALQGAHASGFTEATMIRGEALGENPLQANWNIMSFVAGQGAMVALALGLTGTTRWRNNLFFALALFCLLAAFLPMSRGGIGITLISCATVMLASGVRWGKVLLVASLILASVAMWIPDVVWSRMTLSTRTQEGKVESRERIYTAAVEHFPEYVMLGVGAGNFWQDWGRRSRFSHRHGVGGAHNCFFQAMIYWGLPGLLTLVALIWQVSRCLPRRCGTDPLALCLLGVAVSLLLLMFVSHRLYAKEFAIGIGLLVGSRYWVWPTGVVSPASQRLNLHPAGAG